MKEIIYIYICLLFPFILHAQKGTDYYNKNVRPLDEPIHADLLELHGNIRFIKQTCYKFENNLPNPIESPSSRCYRIEFAPNHKIISMTILMNKKFKPKVSYIYKNYQNNDLIEKKVYNYNDTSTNILFIYDKSGILTEKINKITNQKIKFQIDYWGDTVVVKTDKGTRKYIENYLIENSTSDNIFKYEYLNSKLKRFIQFDSKGKKQIEIIFNQNQRYKTYKTFIYSNYSDTIKKILKYNYIYDNRSELDSLKNIESNIVFYKKGLKIEGYCFNKLNQTFEYNAKDHLIKITDIETKEIITFNYKYDKSDNWIERIKIVNGKQSELTKRIIHYY